MSVKAIDEIMREVRFAYRERYNYESIVEFREILWEVDPISSAGVNILHNTVDAHIQEWLDDE